MKLSSKFADVDEAQGVDGAQKVSVHKVLEASSTGATQRFATAVEFGRQFIAGIDLGTTHSLIGVYDAGFPILFADAEGSRLTPSVVSYQEHGAPLVGKPALRQQLLHPESTIASVKRLMGKQAILTLGTHEVSPEEVSSEILKHLKTIAEERLGTSLTRAVITVPAYFNDAQRAATRKAGELVGFTVERIISEPTAAALAYGLDKLHDQAKVAVYDFGGGTFDLSILQLDHGIFQVLSTHGDTHLGGDDLDQAIATYLLTKAKINDVDIRALVKLADADEVQGADGAQELSVHKVLDTPSTGATRQFAASVELCKSSIDFRLLEAARKAKEELSYVEETTIRLPFLNKNVHLEQLLTRLELEKICHPFIQRTRAFCLRALADARLEVSELDEIILVGGSTRMPLVRSFVQEFFGKPPNLSQHPDEAVALGAVLQGALIEGTLSEITLLDITPLSLGIETFGGLMNVIIPRNTTIPTKAGELFTNAVAGQQAMKITILQGEREVAADNWKLGEIEIPFDPAPKGIARVGVQFEIDADGILKVLVRDVVSGEEKSVAIHHAIEISDEAVEAMLADSLEHAFEDRDARIFTEARLKAEEMLPAVEKALTQLQAEISEEAKNLIRAHAAHVTAAIAENNLSALQTRLQELDEATQTLATLLVEKAMQKAEVMGNE